MGDERRPMVQSMLAMLPAAVRRLPADLGAVVAFLVLCTAVVFVPGVNGTPVRVVVGLPLLLFVPGYSVVAAFFPEGTEVADPASGGPDADSGRVESRGIDTAERVVLSLGLSVALVPLVGIGLLFSPFGLGVPSVVVGLAAVSTVATVAAVRRRRALPPAQRFRVRYRAWYAEFRRDYLRPDTTGDRVLNTVLVCMAVLAVASVGYAVAVPDAGEAYTELYLTPGSGADEFDTDEYPTTFGPGETKQLLVGVGNHEREPMRYTVVVTLQQVRVVDETVRVETERELDRLETPRMADNETWRQEYQFTPRDAGGRTRLVVLLYGGEAPSDPTVESAKRSTQLWLDASA